MAPGQAGRGLDSQGSRELPTAASPASWFGLFNSWTPLFSAERGAACGHMGVARAGWRDARDLRWDWALMGDNALALAVYVPPPRQLKGFPDARPVMMMARRPLTGRPPRHVPVHGFLCVCSAGPNRFDSLDTLARGSTRPCRMPARQTVPIIVGSLAGWAAVPPALLRAERTGACVRADDARAGAMAQTGRGGSGDVSMRRKDFAV